MAKLSFTAAFGNEYGTNAFKIEESIPAKDDKSTSREEKEEFRALCHEAITRLLARIPTTCVKDG